MLSHYLLLRTRNCCNSCIPTVCVCIYIYSAFANKWSKRCSYTIYMAIGNGKWWRGGQQYILSLDSVLVVVPFLLCSGTRKMDLDREGSGRLRSVNPARARARSRTVSSDKGTRERKEKKKEKKKYSPRFGTRHTEVFYLFRCTVCVCVDVYMAIVLYIYIYIGTHTHTVFPFCARP